MDNKKDDIYYIDLIKKDILQVINYTKDISYVEFEKDSKCVDAVLFRLVQISENIKKLSDSFKNSITDVKWNNIIGFRNRIVHDYGNTDFSIVYEICIYDLPKLLEKI